MDVVLETWRSVVSLEEIDTTRDGYALKFASVTLVVAFFAVVLDLCYNVTTGQSFLQIQHGWLKTPMFFVFWPLGSATFSWFGLALAVIQPTMLGAVAAAVAWTLLIRRVVASLADKVDSDDPEE